MSPKLSRLILATAVLVELALFVSVHHERWQKAIRPRGSGGDGLVIRCDGLGYYAWLRSLLIDGDWSFDNEFDAHNALGDFVPPPERRTTLGRRANPWSVGPACAWAVLVVPGHIVLKALGPACPWPADGYSLPYQLLVGGATLLTSLLGLAFLYAACRRFARPERAALAAAFVVLGTTVLYYSAVEPSMAHGVGTTAVAALVWYWLKTQGSVSCRRWLIVGLLVGIAALVRWQLGTFAVLPAGEWALLRGFRVSWRRWLVAPVLAATGAVVAFLPQMVAWRLVYGAWVVTPYPVAHNWLTPSWWQILTTQDRGLFYWTPLALIGVAASARSALASGARLHGLLLAAFLLQAYTVASVWGQEAYLGASYGFRPLTESMVVLAPGLAALLERAPPWRFRLLCGLASLLVLWNLILIGEYRYGWVPAAAGAPSGDLLAASINLLRRKHALGLAQVLLGPVVLAVLAHRSASRPPGFSPPYALGWKERRRAGVGVQPM
jgi:hypothetical protein